MRLIFVNRFYWPETPATAQLLADLAEGLAARGHDVTVIASRPNRSSAQTEVHRGVHILRINATQWGRNQLVLRPLDFMTFLAGMVWQLARLVRAGDWVISMTDPPLLGIAVGCIPRLQRAQVLHWAQDIYPEVASNAAGGRLWNLFTPMLRPLRNRSWRESAGVVTVGHDMAALIAENGVPPAKIRVITNWAPVGLLPVPPAAAASLRAIWGLSDKFVIAYSGNLGRVHDLDPIIEVAAALRAHPTIAFVFIGGGAQRPALEKAVQKRGLVNVHFLPPQARERLGETLAAGDLHWVTLRPGCEKMVFPSKLYGIAAVGRPIFFIGAPDSEVARLIVAHNLGLIFTRDQIAEMAEAIRGLAASPERRAQWGAAGSAFIRRHGQLEQALASWETLLVREPACRASVVGPTLDRQ